MGSGNLWYEVRHLATVDVLRELVAAWLIVRAVASCSSSDSRAADHARCRLPTFANSVRDRHSRAFHRVAHRRSSDPPGMKPG